MTSPRGTNLKGLNLPSTGCLWGADSTNFASGSQAIEAAYTGGGASPTTTGGLGRQMAIRRRHYTGSAWGTSSGTQGNLTFGNNASSGHALGVDEKADALLGLIPCAVLGSQGGSFPVKVNATAKAGSNNTFTNSNGKQGMDRITNGEFDTHFTSMANTLAGVVDVHGNPSPMMLILWQEMDAPAMNCYGGYQGGTTGAGQTSYKNAFAHVAAIVHAQAPNVIVGFCPTFFDPDNNKTTYFPGTPATDWVWGDLYAGSDPFAGGVDDLYNLAVTNGLPFGIAESGVQGGAASIITENQNSAKNSTYSPNMLAYLLWSFTGPGGNNTYYQSLAVYQAYHTFANDAYYASLPSIGSGGGGTAPSGGAPSLSDDTPVTAQGISCAPGTWSGTTPITFTYQWQVSTTGTGGWASATGTGNATQNYTVGTVDLAKFLRCQVTATNSVGSATANSEVSSAVTSGGGGSSTPQVGIVYFENAARAGALSGSANLTAFDNKYMSFTNHEGVSNPSCPDYTASTCGDLPIAQNQGTPIGTFGGSPKGIDAPSAGVGWAGSLHNLFDQLATAGFKWKTYEEGPSVQTSGWNPGDAALTDTPQCATRHSPGAFYTTPSTTIGDSSHGTGRYTFTELTHDITNSSLPDFFWVSPGNFHAGHAPGDLSTANTWMGSPTSGMLANIIAAMKPNGILIISFDNVGGTGTSTGTGVVYCVVAGQNVSHSTNGTYYTHYSLVKGIQNLFNVAPWTGSVDSHYTSVAAMVLPNVGGGLSGSGTGSVAFTGHATGRIGHRGTATGSVAITGLGAGRVSLSRGTAHTAVSFTGAAVGQVIGQANGILTGNVAFTGRAAGTIRGTFIGSGSSNVSFTGSAAGHIIGRSGSCIGHVAFTGIAGGQIISHASNTWWKVVNNGGRGNGVIPDPNQVGRALGIGDVFGHHTTTDNGKTWYARQKGVSVNIGGTAIVYGRTGIWSIKHPGRAYLGLGTLKNGLNAQAKIIDLSGSDPYAQTILPVGSLTNLSFGTNMQDPTPDGTKAAESMPRMGTGHLMDVYYTGSGPEYLFGAHNAGLARWTDEASPVNLVTGTFDGSSVSVPGWKAMIVHVEAGGVPVIYAATYGISGWTGSVRRITNILSGTPTVTTLSDPATTGVCDFSIDDSGNLYACGVNHIWQVTNNGATWTAIDGGVTNGRTVGSLDVASVSNPQKPVFGFNSGTTGNNVWTPANTALGSIAGWRGYLTPAQGIPSTFPGGGQTIPSGVTLPVVSAKPDVPTFINTTTLDAAFQTWCAAAPAGAWVTLWHEGETGDGWSPAQILALHAKAYTLAKAANPNILYGEIVATFTANSSSANFPLGQWIATQTSGAPLDFYGLDAYSANLTQYTPLQETQLAVAAIQAVVPTAQFAITECNANSINSANSPHIQGTSDTARAAAFQNLYAYAVSNNFMTFFPFYFVSTDSIDNYPWDAADTATVTELKNENSDTKAVVGSNTIIVAGMSDFPDATQKSILVGTL